MAINEQDISQYLDPVFRFCAKRLNNRHDAEDLASEIMVHVLHGMKKYPIESLDGWVWRIAHNRYARFIDRKNKASVIAMPERELPDVPDDYDFVDELIIEDEYRNVFKALHALSSEYRNILVDFYIGDQSVKQIAKRYGISEATVKWRLNVSREKIRKRIGANNMDKIYKPINWNTYSCNGSMDSNKYLYSQIARAICEAAYEKPLTVEEISDRTGLPAIYIEDELPRLIAGDAIIKDGSKYATNFIVLRVVDKKAMIQKFPPLVAGIADHFAALFKEQEAEVARMDFYGSNFTMPRLGYITLPALLREKVNAVKKELNIENGPYPPRLDGGYGWFVVDEKETEDESLGDTESGCNITDGEKDYIYYFWLGKYFHNDIYHNGGTRWLRANDIVGKTNNGVIPNDALTDDDRVRLLKNNLIIKEGGAYKLNFPIFTQSQYESFKGCFNEPNTELDKVLKELISEIHKSFKAFVPKRLDSQINQWVSFYTHNIIGFVAEELINRGVLERPGGEKPLTNGVFCILGEYVNV
jgi:RNA polymerase sigma factor (sigma-70 family)